jgi:arylsulfatase A-like enzyme
MATGFPGYNSIIPKDAVSVEILKENGYATSWFGKNHNTPSFVASQAGPFDQWPIGMGLNTLRICWWRHQPVATEPIPQHDGDLSLSQ